MPEALAAASTEAQHSEALAPQTGPTVPDQQQTPLSEQKPEKTDAERRSESVRKAIEKAQSEKPEDKTEDKAEGKAKPDEAKSPEDKPEQKAKADPKAERDPAKPDDGEGEDAPRGKADGDDGKASDEPEDSGEDPRSIEDAPRRFPKNARADWAAVPESVKSAVHRAVREAEQGIEKYRSDAQEFDKIRRFHDMASQHGTTVSDALENYTGMERMLRTSPLAGLEQIVQNLGLRHPNGNPITFRDIAIFVAQQDPTEAQNMQLKGRLAAIEQAQAEQTQQQQAQAARQQTVGIWEAFVAENPQAAELEPQIAEFLQKYPAGGNVSVKERLEDALAFVIARSGRAAQTGPTASAQTQKPRQTDPDGKLFPAGAPRGTPAVSKKKLSRSDSVRNAMTKLGL